MALALTLHQIGAKCIVLEAVQDLRPLGVEEASAVLRGTADQTATGRLAALARLGKGTLDDPDALPPLLLALMALAFVIEGLLTYERRTPPSGPSLGSRA